MMKLRFLNKNIEHKRFTYSPMYYDEQKEKLENKKAQYRSLEGDELSSSERESILRQNMRQEFNRAEYRQSQLKASNFRIVLLIGLLLALGYFVLFGIDEVDTVVKKLW